MSRAKGDLAVARRMLRMSDDILALCHDPGVFTSVNYKEVQAIERGITSSRTAIANVMSHLGDWSGYLAHPPEGRATTGEHDVSVGEKLYDGLSQDADSGRYNSIGGQRETQSVQSEI